MKNLKAILLTIIAAFMIVSPFTMSKVNAEGKVKVYIFEAGWCPYCEAEMEYLKSLESYGEKFEIIQKELYIDHVDWEQGKDYELGVKVATAFQDKGIKDASYQGTPFVVISDLYAASAYSTSLETYINQAYDEGDKDVVGCFEKGGENCLSEKSSDGSETIRTVALVIIIVGLVAAVIFSRKNTKDEAEYDDERDYDSEEDNEDEDSEVEDIVETPKKKTTNNKSNKKNKNKKK